MSPDGMTPPDRQQIQSDMHSVMAGMYQDLQSIHSTIQRSLSSRSSRLWNTLQPVVHALGAGVSAGRTSVVTDAGQMAPGAVDASSLYGSGLSCFPADGSPVDVWYDAANFHAYIQAVGGPPPAPGAEKIYDAVSFNYIANALSAGDERLNGTGLPGICQPSAVHTPPPPPPPPPPPSCDVTILYNPDLWYVVSRPDRLQYESQQGPAALQRTAGGWFVLGGPFKTRQEAEAFQNDPASIKSAQNGCFPAQPAQPAQPPQPTKPPPKQWICAQFQGRKPTVYDYQQYLNQSATEQTVYAGPVRDTQEEAMSDCLLRKISPPTEQSVDWPKFPRWCSEDVCQSLDSLTQAFKQWSANNRNKSLDDSGHIIPGSRLDNTLSQVPVIGTLAKTIINWAAPALLKAGGDYGAQITVGLSALVIRGIAGFVEHWTHIGLRDIHQTADYYLNWISPTEIPSAPECDDALIKGIIADETWKCYVSANNICPDPRRVMLQARYRRPTWEEGEELFRRGAIDARRRDRYYRTDDIVDSEDKDAFAVLYDELPTIADHLHWLQRNVDDDEYVQRYSLLDGFSTDEVINQLPGMEGYVTRYNVSGRDFWKKYGKDLIAQGMKIEYAANHYAAHWINPAPGQLLEMVYRLRPDKEGVRNPFRPDDYMRILAEQDVGPFFQRRFDEIKYHVPALSYLRDMYRQYLLSDAEMQSYHQDLGYSLKDSELFVSIDKVIRERMRTSGYHGWTPAALSSAWAIRAINRAKVYEEMGRQGWTTDEANDLMDRADAEMQRSAFMRARSRALTSVVTYVRQAIQVGVSSVEDAAKTLEAAGWPKSYAKSLAEQEGINANVALVKQAVSAVRRSFLRGEVDSDGASAALSQVGITPAARSQYLIVWRLQLTTHHKSRSASQIVSDVAAGRLSKMDAMVRLHNMGYDDADSRLYMADAEGKIASREARGQAAAERATVSAARQQAKLAAQAQKQAEKLMAAAQRKEPPGRLQKWLGSGIITLDRFNQRMKMYGYDDVEIALYAEEAMAVAAKKGKLAPPKPIKAGQKRPKGPSMGVLRRWVKEGLIGYDYFIAALAQMEIIGDDAQRYWEDACAQKNAQCAPTTPQPQPGPSVPGSGG